MKKRLLALLLFACVFCSGCTAPVKDILSSVGQAVDEALVKDFGSTSSEPAETELLTAADSTVTLSIYPDGCEYKKTAVGGYLFSQLNEEQQSIYIKIDNAIFNMQTGYIDIGECSYRDLELAYHCIRRDRPEYFWLPFDYSTLSTGDYRQIKFAETEADWNCSAEERTVIEDKIRKTLSELYKKLNGVTSEYETELILYEWLTEKVSYDASVIGKHYENPWAWGIDGVFDKEKAVCEGYAKALQVLFNMAGLESTPVTGIVGQPHMWNVVKIDGEWYHVDATSDDADTSPTHFFFNLSDEAIYVGRTISPDFTTLTDEQVSNDEYNFAIPSCRSQRNSYFIKNDTYISSGGNVTDKITDIVCRAVRLGESSVEIGFAPEIGIDKMSDIESELDLAEALQAVNDNVEPSKRISRYSWVTVNGSTAIKIIW